MHIAIHGFVNEEGTKPADEHNLQASPTLRQTLFTGVMTNTGNLQITTPNTDGTGKKLVTAFAPHLDKSVMRERLETLDNFIKGAPMHNTRHANANAAPWWLAHRDSDLSKEVGEVPGGHTPPTLSPYTAGPLGVIIFRLITLITFYNLTACPYLPAPVIIDKSV